MADIDSELKLLEQRILAALDSLDEKIKIINTLLSDSLSMEMHCIKCGHTYRTFKDRCPECGSHAVTPTEF